MAVAASLPLEGVRVVDLTTNISGPYASMILGDLGADVVKIERPGRGDDARLMAPTRAGTSAYFMAVNRNKGSVALDLRAEGDRARLDALLAEADVFVSNMRPHKLAALGLDFETLHARLPRLVYGEITAYGNEGDEVERAGYDMVLQARAGLMSVNGEPGRPAVRVGVSILDMGSGLWLALGVAAALRARDRTGEGSLVSTSLLEVGAAFMAYDCAAYQMTGELPQKRGSEHPAFAPYGVFACAGGEIAIGVGADHLFERLAHAVGAPEWLEDPRFASNAQRVAHKEALRAALEARLSAKPAADWAVVLGAANVPADVVAAVDDVLADEQLAAVDMWVDVPLPDGLDAARDSWRLPGLPLRFARTRPPVRLAPPPPPRS